MPTLEAIPPAVNAGSFSDGGANSFAGLPARNGEPFDYLMTRALSAPQTGTKKAASTAPDKMPRQLQPRNETENSKPTGMKTKAQVSETDGGKSDENNSAGTNKSPAQAEGKTVSTDFLNLPIPFLASQPQLLSSAATAKSGSAEAVTSIFSLPPGKMQNLSTGLLAEQGAVAPKSGGASGASPFQKISPPAAGAAPEPDPAAKPAIVSTEKILRTLSALATGKTPAQTPVNLPATTSENEGDTKQVAGAVKETPGFLSPATDHLSTAPAAPEPALKTPAQIFPPAHGTVVAKQDVTMKNAEETNKVAGSGGQILPGETVLAARVKNLPVIDSPAPVMPRAARVDSLFTIMPAASAASSATGSPDNVIPLSAPAEVRSLAVERTHEMVMQNAMQLQTAGADLLRVVIKPGAGTQLSLELSQHGNGVEAQAVLQKGDFAHLNQHWPELQQRLEQRGIRLAPLVSEQSFSDVGGGQNQFQRRPDKRSKVANCKLPVPKLQPSTFNLQPPAHRRAAGNSGPEFYPI